MSTTKKYDVNCKGNFLDKYPNFNHLLTGLDFTPFNKDTPDNMARYIVFLYSKDCPLHKEKFAFEDRQLDALKKFNIPITYLKMPEFAKNENEMAYKFMSTNGDIDFELYVSLKSRHSWLCRKLREMDEKIDWKKDNESLDATTKLIAQGVEIKKMEDTLFGNIEELKNIIDNQNNAKMGAAEKYAL